MRYDKSSWILWSRRVAVVAICVTSLGWTRLGAASEHGEKPAKSEHAEQAEHSEAPPAESADATKSGSDGIELGQFLIRAYYPDKSQKSTATFALYATVTKDKLAESQHFLENRQNKMRDQVIVVTRLIPLGDFDDPELKNFRRRILVQLRRALPELSIDNVYVSDFDLKVERI